MDRFETKRSQQQSLSSEEFRDVIGSFASGVTVVTARQDGEPVGTTASAVSSLSLRPPMLLVCMNRSSKTGHAMAASGRFGINILSDDQPDVAQRFATSGGRKFEGISLLEGTLGVPLLADALAMLECRTVEEVAGGTHLVFIAEVDRASARHGSPLAYFRGEFGRLELGHDQHTAEEIRAMITGGELAGGESIDASELSDQLPAQLGIVNHALGRLVADGLLTREPDGSIRVARVDLALVEDALEARRAIELGVAAATLGRLRKTEIAELGEILCAATCGGSASGLGDELASHRAFDSHFAGLCGECLNLAYHRFDALALIAGLGDRDRRREIAGDIAAAAHVWRPELIAAYAASDAGAARRSIDGHIDRLRGIARQAGNETLQ